VSWEKKDPTVLKKKLIWNEHVHELLSHYFAEVLPLTSKNNHLDHHDLISVTSNRQAKLQQVNKHPGQLEFRSQTSRTSTTAQIRIKQIIAM
jgi:hypothetical protein